MKELLKYLALIFSVLMLNAIPAFSQGTPIGSLPDALLPLTGTELIPIYQDNQTKKTTLANVQSVGGNMTGSGQSIIGEVLLAHNTDLVLNSATASVLLSATSKYMLLQNNTAVPLTPVGNGIVLNAANGTGEYIEGDTYGDFGGFILVGRRSSGTALAPTALATGKTITGITGGGYDGSVWTTTNPPGEYDILAGGNWSKSSHPTIHRFYTTPVNSTNEQKVFTIETDGTLFAGADGSLTTHNTGIGTVNVAKGYYVDHGGAPKLLSCSDITGTICTTSSSNTWTGIQTFRPRILISNNTEDFLTSLGTTGIIINGANSASNFIESDTYGNGAATTLYGRRSGGTASAPTALAGGVSLLSLIGGGYDGAAWTGTSNPGGELDIIVGGTWSGSSHPTIHRFFNTPVNSTNEEHTITLETDGTLFVGLDPSLTTHNTGLGTVNVAAGYYVDHNGSPAPLNYSDLAGAPVPPPPVSMTVSTATPVTVPNGTSRVYVTTSAAVSITLPRNDCLIIDRTGNRANAITVIAPSTTLINGVANYTLVNSWQASMFIWDGSGFGVFG